MTLFAYMEGENKEFFTKYLPSCRDFPRTGIDITWENLLNKSNINSSE